MTALRGRLITAERDIPDAVIEVEGDRITSVREAGPTESIAATDDLILPGLVDLHCHGGGGASFTIGDRAQVTEAATHHLQHGTTTLVGSVVTDAPDRMLAAVAALADGVDAADLAAIHVEGPFLSAARCGAQDPAWLREPDLDFATAMVDAGRGHVRVMTIAPELPGASALATMLTERGVVIAVGHTEADATTTEQFLRSAAPALVTHLFNGMAPIHHRDPGPVVGALAAASAGAAVVELIGDGVHLSDETVAGVIALLGGSRVALVTDAIAAAGMADGDFLLGPQAVRVRDGVARLANDDSIAGGTSRLLDVVRRQVAAGLDPIEVVACASTHPAGVLGLANEIGVVRAGLRADLLVVDRDWRPRRVMRAGTWAS